MAAITDLKPLRFVCDGAGAAKGPAPWRCCRVTLHVHVRRVAAVRVTSRFPLSILRMRIHVVPISSLAESLQRTVSALPGTGRGGVSAIRWAPHALSGDCSTGGNTLIFRNGWGRCQDMRSSAAHCAAWPVKAELRTACPSFGVPGYELGLPPDRRAQ